MTAWVKWKNTHGGINGHPIDLITEVEPGSPAIATSDVQKLMSQGVVALVDGDSNDPDWAPMVKQAGLPVFLTNGQSLAFAGSSDGFGPLLSPTLQAEEQLIEAQKVGVKNLSVLYCTEYSACQQAVPYYTAVAKQFGINVVYSAAVSGSAPNYLAQCLNAKQSGANGMIIAANADVAIRVAANCAQQGYTPRQVSSSGSFNKAFAGSKGTDGLISGDSTVPFYDINSPAIREMTDTLNKYNPSITKAAAYNDIAVWNWAVGNMISEAAKAGAVGTTNPMTPAALLNGVYALRTSTAGGLTPPMTFSAGHPQTNRCFYTAAIKNGHFVLPEGLKTTCVPSS